MGTATISDIAWRGHGLCGQRHGDTTDHTGTPCDGMASQPAGRLDAMSLREISGGSESCYREETDITATKAAPA